MNIHAMCDDEVESRLKYLASKERELLHLILAHINEIEIRRIFLARGHSSMYEYLTKELQYSGAAAMRRLSAARLMREIPSIARQIHVGAVNLSQLSELSRALREKEKTGIEISTEQKVGILQSVMGKNTLETQREIAQGLNVKLKKPELIRMQRDESVHLAITFSKEQHELVLKARDKAAHLLTSDYGRDHSFSSFFEILAKSYLYDRLQVERSLKLHRRLENELSPTNFDQSEQELQNPSTKNEITVPPAKPNKTVTKRLRNLVLARDKHCQYVDPLTGKKCQSTYGLEADHKTSKWAGGENNLENLQAMCSAHNKFKYQQESGIKIH